MTEGFLRYWGKAERESPRYHPLAYHGLDVAAVGRTLLERDDLLRRRLSSVSGIEESALVAWVTFLLAIHDLGKFADGFQNLRSDLFLQLQGRETRADYPERHDTLGFRVWEELLERRLWNEQALYPAGDLEDWSEVAKPWFLATMGHHGVPPRPRFPKPRLEDQFPATIQSDAASFVVAAARAFLPATFPISDEITEATAQRHKRASWLFAGLAITADWIGSNAEWFEFCSTAHDLAEYWETFALPSARLAVTRSGVLPSRVASARGLGSLWPEMTSATPLQRLAETIEIAERPQIFVLEEVTGGGKTEAALVLAHRLMARGAAQGLYLALPTMATANAMFRRVAPMYRHLFEPSDQPSAVLAHSRRELFGDLGLAAIPIDAPYADKDPTASALCSAWLADNRKRALLASVGVGTIDQALIAVLPLRHQALRLVGLAGKVLIVDEVHACDAYVENLLCALLTFHAAFGGSAILLSATLPKAQRERFLRAFARGAGDEKPSVASGEYPLLTHFAGGPPLEIQIAARSAASRRVEIGSFRDSAAVIEHLVASAEQGSCVGWIRNTVGEAIAAYEALSERLGTERVLLFHSRFTVGDRAAIEAEVLHRFGPTSGRSERQGRVLVATQVIEQSLDIDLDVLVSDLAPIDLLVQRAGRMHRHVRDAEGNRGETNGRGVAKLWLHGPEPIDTPPKDWFSSFSSGAAYIYPDHGRIWLSAHWLEGRGGFSMPDDARELIEFVYGEESSGRIPAALEQRTVKAEGDERAKSSLAQQNALKLNHGYEASSLEWVEDAITPTRLGDETVTLCLVREVDGQFEPWCQEGDHRWQRSEVQVRRNLVAAEDPSLPAATLDALKRRMPGQGRYVVVAILRSSVSLWTGHAKNHRGDRVELRYCSSKGLVVQGVGGSAIAESDS